MAKYYHLDTVDARQAEEPEQIVTRDGISYVQPGQWIVNKPGEGSSVMDDSAFSEHFVELNRDNPPEEWQSESDESTPDTKTTTATRKTATAKKS